MHKNNYVKLYTVYEFFKFKIYYYQETVYKHSTRTKDLSPRSKGKGTNLFNLQTKYRKNYTNFYKKKESKFSRKLYTKI